MATKAEKAALLEPKKAWVIQEIGWEYDDESYYRGNSRGGTARKVFADRMAAHRECGRMNAERCEEEKGSDNPMEDRDGEAITEFFEVIEVEVV